MDTHGFVVANDEPASEESDGMLRKYYAWIPKQVTDLPLIFCSRFWLPGFVATLILESASAAVVGRSVPDVRVS